MNQGVNAGGPLPIRFSKMPESKPHTPSFGQGRAGGVGQMGQVGAGGVGGVGAGWWGGGWWGGGGWVVGLAFRVN